MVFHLFQLGEGTYYNNRSPPGEIILQTDVSVIIIGGGLEANLEVTRERSGQDNLCRACGYEYGVDNLTVLVVETERVVAQC